MNENTFMVAAGKRVQEIEGQIEVAPTVGAATEAKQDAIITELQLKADLTETQPVSLASVPSHPVTFTGSTDVATNTTLATRLSESDFDTKTGSLTEGAPASDTASSGLNGRLQRIAQRITSLIALLPTALGQGTMATSLKVVLPSDQSAIPVTMTSTTVTNTVATKEVRSATPTQTSPAPTASSTSILASNTNRLGATIYNEGAAICYMKLGGTASLTSYTLQIAVGGYFECPFGYTGAIDGITSSGTAQLRVTELAS